MIDPSITAQIIEAVPNMIGFMLALAFAYKVAIRVADTNKELALVLARIAENSCKDNADKNSP